MQLQRSSLYHKDQRIGGILSSSAALQTYRNEVQHGPIFGCSICHQHHYKSGVVHLDQVYHHLEQHNLEHLVNRYYTDHLLTHQLHQLGRLWCCKGCRNKVARGATPAVATENMLSVTWLHQPDLSQAEHQAVSQHHPLLTLSVLPSTLSDRETVLVVPTFPADEVASNCTKLKSFLDLVHCKTGPYTLRPQV